MLRANTKSDRSKGLIPAEGRSVARKASHAICHTRSQRSRLDRFVVGSSETMREKIFLARRFTFSFERRRDVTIHGDLVNRDRIFGRQVIRSKGPIYPLRFYLASALACYVARRNFIGSQSASIKCFCESHRLSQLPAEVPGLWYSLGVIIISDRRNGRLKGKHFSYSRTEDNVELGIWKEISLFHFLGTPRNRDLDNFPDTVPFYGYQLSVRMVGDARDSGTNH